MDRRDFLRLGAVGAGAAAFAPLSACAPDELPIAGHFPQGIASGLHSPTQVVLWTRVDPRVSAAPSCTWEVASDPAMTTVVASGTAPVSAGADHCVKVLVGGLAPDTNYWYRFTADAMQSPVGRTRTLPVAAAPVGSLKLAVTTCQHYSAGFYSAWRQISQQPLDAVLFLGDYIYENSMGPIGVRSEPIATCKTAEEYRAKYRRYKTDPDLQAAHAAHPWMVIWDDHELWNDHDSVEIATQQARADAAHEAWFLYQPVWPIDHFQIYRSLRWGNLADLALLDTRQYRGTHLDDGLLFTEMTPELADPNRSLLGSTQRDWLLNTLTAAETDNVAWKLLGSQVMVSPIRFVDLDTPEERAKNPGLVRHAGLYTNTDGWTGFSAERDVLLNHLGENEIGNVIVLTGDYHAFFQADVRQDYDDDTSPHVLTEFVVSSITSTTLNLVEQVIASANGGLLAAHPALNFSNLDLNGWGLFELVASKATMTFYGHDSKVNETPRPIARFEVPSGTNRATRLPL